LALAFALLFLPFCFKRFLLDIFFFSSRRKEKKTIGEKKMQRREGAYLSSLVFAFGMKCSSRFSSPHSFNIEFSTFLKPCVSCLLKVLCYSSSKALSSSRDGMNGK
jgi:hypothetical protein